jgi:hypothetical protein
MNTNAIRILFLKDLFLSRWPLFGYLVGGLLSVMVACLPGELAGFIGFILMVTVTIAAGIHLIGVLLLAVRTGCDSIGCFSESGCSRFHRWLWFLE